MNNATPSLRGPLRTLLVAVLALLAGFTLAACTSPTSGSLPDYAPESGATQAAPAAPADGTTDAAGSAERQVTRTAALTVTVPDPTAAAQRVREVTTGLGGYVTSEQVTTLNAGAQPTATLTVSVPADKLDQVLTDLAGIGELAYRQVDATDVTDAIIDVDARIRTLEASIARISALMERAGTVTEIAQVESELSSRQAELERLRAQQAAYATAVERSTITVTLQTPSDAVAANPFLDAFADSWAAVGASARFLLLLVGALTPFALVGGLVAGITWLVVRRRVRRPAQRDPQREDPQREDPQTPQP
ncbi:DUF4349 domain-containing protein [Propioniciclava sp.]|uniref:DUF4349 domain-containing protein n=1 Tax=Propioniciclava sp. TaxID=2038686 RepID=UPI002617FE16|nr:DUF4349 domain-containing protein [Propioniciclava sp.]